MQFLYVYNLHINASKAMRDTYGTKKAHQELNALLRFAPWLIISRQPTHHVQSIQTRH